MSDAGWWMTPQRPQRPRITQPPDQHLYEANLAQSDSEAPRSDEVDDSPNEESLPVKTHFDVAPAIPDDVKASMIGAAHDAAWSAVAARPAEGWRNSHDITGDPVMQKAHDDAHVAFDVVLGVDSPPDVKSASYCAAVQAATLILHWWATGRAVPSYHDFVPRPSATNEFGRDEFGTPRNALAP